MRCARTGCTQIDVDMFKVVMTSTSGSPDITFTFNGDTFSGELDGAKVYGEAERDGAARIRHTDATGEILADVTAHPRGHRDATENATDIACALMWSHWRWTQAQRQGASAACALVAKP
jgi:hypothetical protein